MAEDRTGPRSFTLSAAFRRPTRKTVFRVPTLPVLLLTIIPAKASYLMISVGVSAFVGRVLCSFLPDLSGRRASRMLTCLGDVAMLFMTGYLAHAYIGAVSVFWLMLMGHPFFGGGSYTIIAPYMAEVWPVGLRASGMGLGYAQ